jgi:hypothetical protein
MAHSSLVLGLDSICALISFYLLFRLLLKSKSAPSHPPLPPGPRGLPVIGNLLQIPSSVAWETYADWSQKYGMQLVSYAIQYI